MAERAAAYLAFLRRRFATGPACPEPLFEMVRVNVEEGLGPEWTASLGPLERAMARLPDAPAVALDGRMLPHEWLEVGGRWVKTDGLDHHDDHFFPGCADACWDLAGATVELALDAGERGHLLELYGRLSGDRDAASRLPFYLAAYLAFRLGYAATSARSLGASPDGVRFAALERDYAARLRNTLQG